LRSYENTGKVNNDRWINCPTYSRNSQHFPHFLPNKVQQYQSKMQVLKKVSRVKTTDKSHRTNDSNESGKLLSNKEFQKYRYENIKDGLFAVLHYADLNKYKDDFIKTKTMELR